MKNIFKSLSLLVIGSLVTANAFAANGLGGTGGATGNGGYMTPGSSGNYGSQGGYGNQQYNQGGSYGTQGYGNQGQQGSYPSGYYQQGGYYQGGNNTQNGNQSQQNNPYDNQNSGGNNYNFPGTSDNYAPNRNYWADNTTTRESSSEAKFARDTAATPEDKQLNNRIRDKVSRGYLWDSYTDVILNTTDGIVTLSGSVKNESDKDKLAKEIEKINGVKKVILALKVQDNR